jgi:hypothetical protein
MTNLEVVTQKIPGFRDEGIRCNFTIRRIWLGQMKEGFSRNLDIVEGYLPCPMSTSAFQFCAEISTGP